MPTLGVGCHVVLVDGAPDTPTQGRLRSLVDRKTGRLHPVARQFFAATFTGRIRTAEIEAEAAAQIALLQSYGVRLTHVDTHKHTHMFPLCAATRCCAQRGRRGFAVRNPFEPHWSLEATPMRLETTSQVKMLLRGSSRFPPYRERRRFHDNGWRDWRSGDGTINIAAVSSLLSEHARGHVGAGHASRLSG